MRKMRSCFGLLAVLIFALPVFAKSAGPPPGAPTKITVMQNHPAPVPVVAALPSVAPTIELAAIAPALFTDRIPAPRLFCLASYDAPPGITASPPSYRHRMKAKYHGFSDPMRASNQRCSYHLQR